MLRYFKRKTIYQYKWDISSNIFDIRRCLRPIPLEGALLNAGENGHAKQEALMKL